MLEDSQIEETTRVGQRFKSEAILGNGGICSGGKKLSEHNEKNICLLNEAPTAVDIFSPIWCEST